MRYPLVSERVTDCPLVTATNMAAAIVGDRE